MWQYSHHVLAGLRTHEGPILTVANFAGDWPGLVGLLGLNAGLTKMQKPYSTIWSVDFTDDWFAAGLAEWVESGTITHDASHVRALPELPASPERDLGYALGDQLMRDKAIIGVFDEGCMGMYNAIFAEGILNSTERPPVFSRDGQRELHAGRAFPHFKEADEGVAVDALITDRVWTAMGMVPDNTLHDVRWGEEYDGQFVWVYEISGSVPASHLGGWQNAEGWRQDPVFFPAGGSTINGVSKPGELVLSRVFLADGQLQVDIFRGSAIELPADETERRKQATNPEWPIAHVVLHGVSRDQFMARHKANHVQMVYADDAASADKALLAKAAMFERMGLVVNLIGDVAI
ncbi:hypothetical protein ACQUSY_04270 [Microbacterium sp. YY-03]|uniref:hypothetical protein n=1 Tax=Microbacterium sp. YY-03 TaxID=3421636 RepID=UPI003D16BB2B